MDSYPFIGACIRIFVWELPDDRDRMVWARWVHFSALESYLTTNSFPAPAHLSENWGYVSFSPVIGGNLFSLMFGRNLDAHVPAQDLIPSLVTRFWSSITLVPRELPSEHQCFDGKACYLGSLQVTLVACIASLGLSWWAGIRDRQKVKGRNACL